MASDSDHLQRVVIDPLMAGWKKADGTLISIPEIEKPIAAAIIKHMHAECRRAWANQQQSPSSNTSGSNWHQQRVWQVNRRESSEATPARSLESAAGCIPEQTTEWGGPDIPHTGNLRRRPGDRPSMVGTHPLEAVQSSTAGRSVAITHLPGLGRSEPAGETESIHLEVDYHRQWTHQGGWAGLEPKIRLSYHWRVEQRSLDIHLHRSGRRATSSWVVWLDDSPL